ncbi:MAG: UPF0280 family protein [Methanobrevibacter sp.]|uniref:UPF0280 family protein n=1 Tax=Methanobrevibacter sp. TaxID=66852 RepID=UPI0025F035ED|nr:UPF0280 family protein [Methanobrevibacter sp.]MBQ6100093.1 UPF0280 family protein [Methanobrevibacter sp.]
MNFQQIDLDETHIRLTTDLPNHDLKRFIFNIRRDLKNYILKNKEFSLALEPLEMPEMELASIVFKMYESSAKADVGPMACVAGTISEMSLEYLINNGSNYSIVENGGDISLVNDKKVLCGIYSNNEILGNNIAFEIKSRKKPLGICTSSAKIGHSISFGQSDSVTVIGESSSVCDGLATRIANDVVGDTSEDKVSNALECCENFRQYFYGVLIVCDENVGTIGKLPRIVESEEFTIKL